MSEPKKAIALISGGLDSLLAARVIQDQGIHVHLVPAGNALGVQERGNETIVLDKLIVFI